MAKLRWKEGDLGGYLNGKITLELGKVTNSISVAKLHWKGGNYCVKNLTFAVILNQPQR